MSVLSGNGHDDERPSRLPLIAVSAGVAFLVLVGAWWWSRPAPAEPPSSAPAVVERAPASRPAPAAEAPAPVSPTPERPTARRERPPKEKPAAPPPVAEPAAPAGPTLVVDSDVPGASVFLNRRYLGTTPLNTTDVTAGSGQLNVSAQGYDGVARTVDIAGSGVTEVTVRLKEVRLDASVAVVHKHGMGSCEGTLRASVDGLRYDSSNKGDSFALPFGQVETFAIEYLQKSLKVKQRGGKTWNFTTKDDTADGLFLFHRDVEKARQKLASR